MRVGRLRVAVSHGVPAAAVEAQASR